jgi:hypothetical protein
MDVLKTSGGLILSNLSAKLENFVALELLSQE